MAVETTVEASTTAEDMDLSNMTAMAGSRAATAATRYMTVGALLIQPPSKSCRAADSAGQPTIRQHAFV